MPSKKISRAIVLANGRRPGRTAEIHSQRLQAGLMIGLDELDAHSTLVHAELALNAAVITSAAACEMAVAERLIQRAGGSRVAQTIAADRINRLIQVNDRTLSRNGF